MNRQHALHLAFITLVSTTPIAAQSLHASRDKSVVQTQLTKIEDDIARANRECDYAYFRRVEASEFIFTDATGARTSREQDLAGEKDCKKSSNVQTLDEIVVQLHGDVAIMNARAAMPGTRDSQATVRRSRFTDVFVWRDARWQLVVGHSSRIP